MSDPVSPSRAGAPEQAGRILVVDDEEMVRTVASRILTESGFAVHLAADGMGAVDLLGQHGDAVECVVSDIVMPRLDGVGLLSRVGRIHTGLAVVFVSGYGATQLATYGLPAPCAVLGKPFRPELLIAEVKRCLVARGRP